MKTQEALHVIAEITASQWGMVTSAQASARGITRLDLSRLATAGHLKRLAHGVYLDAGTPSSELDDLRAAWLSTDPKVMGEARVTDRSNTVIVAGASAARLHTIGDLWANRHDFTYPTRRQSQRAEIRYRQRVLDPRDVTLVEGLPTMTMERTIADLVEEVGDLSLVADALRDASRKRNLDLVRLRELLAPLAARNGLKSGAALLDQLMEIAGIDADAVARRVAADPSLGSRIAATYLRSLSAEHIIRLVATPEMQKSLHSIQEAVAAVTQQTMAPQLNELSAALKQAGTEIAKGAVPSALSHQVTAQLADSDLLPELGRTLAKILSESQVPQLATIAAISEAQRALADD